MLRRLTLVALAFSLLFAQAAVAKDDPARGQSDPPGYAKGHDKGFSDGR